MSTPTGRRFELLVHTCGYRTARVAPIVEIAVEHMVQARHKAGLPFIDGMRGAVDMPPKRNDDGSPFPSPGPSMGLFAGYSDLHPDLIHQALIPIAHSIVSAVGDAGDTFDCIITIDGTEHLSTVAVKKKVA